MRTDKIYRSAFVNRKEKRKGALDIIIREDKEKYMWELKKWLLETKESGLEEMSSFFSARLDIYEEHMSIWTSAYRRFAKLLPKNSKKVLDLGCGTGLELDEIFSLFPEIEVTGVDLCCEMLDKLAQKHPDKNFKTVCSDYFRFDLQKGHWDAVISFESLHHFLPGDKLVLYRKIRESLKDNGVFLLGDYIACCDEEETLLREAWREKRARFSIPEGRFVHFDIPLTLEHETEILQKAGFSEVLPKDSLDGATLILARK